MTSQMPIGAPTLGHVAFVNPINEFYSPISGGAVTTIVMQNTRELVARGHRVSVLTQPGPDENYEVGDVTPLASTQRADLNFLRRARSRISERRNRWGWSYYDVYLRSVIAHLRERQPDAAIFFNDLVAPYHIHRSLPGLRLFVNLQNEVRLRQTRPAPLLEPIEKLLACSRYIRDWTADHYKLPSEKLAVLNSGVDLSAFYPREDYLEAAQPLRVLFVGRIDRNKGPDLAADAVAQLRREGLKVELTVAGGLWFYGHGNENADPYFRDLKEKMDAAGAQYLGHITRKEIGGVFRQHDVVCVLSRSAEPFGLVVLEAMASGCAVIASDRGGLPDACGTAGFLMDPEDVNRVTETLRVLSTDSDALRGAKKRSHEHALNCSWATKVDELEKLL